MIDRLDDDLLAALRAAVRDGATVLTLANRVPNFIQRVGAEGVHVQTLKSLERRAEAQLVPAWMIQTAWNHLHAHGSLSNGYLLSNEGLNVKRSSAVCALLAQLPDVEVASTRPIVLRLRGCSR